MKIKENHFKGMAGTKNVQRGNTNYTVRDNRERFFFPDEWMAFYDQLKTKQKVTFEFLVNTGARIMEVQNIKVQDIDFERDNIVLRKVKRQEKKEGKKIRVISISTKFSKYIRKIVKQNNLGPNDVFPILSTPAANIGMKKALKKAGIKDYEMFSLQNVRKTFETWMLGLGIDSFKTAKHVGHSIAVAFKHYVSPDTFNFEDKRLMREIIGDLYSR